MNKKTWIFIGALAVFVVIIALIYFLTRTDNLISKTKVKKGIVFSDAKITKVGEKYNFYVKVSTSSDSVLKVEDFDAIVYNKKGVKIGLLTGYIGTIDKNSIKEITVDTTDDLSDAYEINYTLRISHD